ncbi:hypothetical protein LXL04_027194 [Taraxacum kok-saghyz]
MVVRFIQLQNMRPVTTFPPSLSRDIRINNEKAEQQSNKAAVSQCRWSLPLHFAVPTPSPAVKSSREFNIFDDSDHLLQRVSMKKRVNVTSWTNHGRRRRRTVADVRGELWPTLERRSILGPWEPLAIEGDDETPMMMGRRL